MFNDSRYLIVAIIIVLALVFFGLSRGYIKEGFTEFNYETPITMDDFYNGPTRGIEDYLIDNLTCHPSCCGDQWPVPFDGLTPTEMNKCLITKGSPGPFVRTNFTCANGLNGHGCPCIPRKTYMFLANRGMNAHSLNYNEIEPTLLIKNNMEDTDINMSPYQEIQESKSVRRNQVKLNDLSLERHVGSNINKVKPVGSSLMPKDMQVEKFIN